MSLDLIRKAKNISTEKAIGTQFSRATYYRMVNESHRVGLRSFLALQQRLYLFSNEIDFINQLSKQTESVFVDSYQEKIEEAIKVKDVEVLTGILEEVNKQEKDKGTLFWTKQKNLLECVIADITNQTVSEETLRQIKNDVFSIESWFKKDLLELQIFIKAISIDKINHLLLTLLTSDLLEALESTYDMSKETIILDILCDILELYLTNGYNELFEKLSRKLLKMITCQRSFDTKLKIQFYEVLYIQKQTNDREDKKAEKIIFLLEKLNCRSIVSQLTEFKETYLGKYELNRLIAL